MVTHLSLRRALISRIRTDDRSLISHKANTRCGKICKWFCEMPSATTFRMLYRKTVADRGRAIHMDAPSTSWLLDICGFGASCTSGSALLEFGGLHGEAPRPA
jgi:hypothetical protein